MGAAITVLKIKQLEKEKFEQKKIILKKQSELGDFEGFENIHIGYPKTIIEKMYIEKELHYSKVSMNSDTIKEPIYIYWEGMEEPFKEITTGYQKILNFVFAFNKDYTEIYIFASREVANLFIRRLRREKYISCDHLKFDFKRISELKNMDSAWGVWEDYTGIERKRARFGKGINEIIDDKEYESITTIYMDYKYGAEIIQLTLNVEGRISSFSKNISQTDMMVIFEEIREILC